CPGQRQDRGKGDGGVQRTRSRRAHHALGYARRGGPARRCDAPVRAGRAAIVYCRHAPLPAVLGMAERTHTQDAAASAGLTAHEWRAAMDLYHQSLVEHREELDSLNVFPVPDGDTGSNLLATQRAVVDALSTLPPDAAGADA